MPEDQGKLGHLLPLLAQLQKRRLPRVRLHQLGNPLQHAPVLLGHANLAVALKVICRSSRDDAAAGHGCTVVARDAIVVLLLSLGCGLRGGSGLRLSLSLRLRLELTVLGYMVILVLVVAL